MKSNNSLAKQQQFFQQALFLHQSGQWPEAVALYQKLLKKLPNNPQILAELGTISLKQGHFDLAVRYFRQSLTALPNQANTLINFALALSKLKRFDEALLNYDRAIALNTDHALAHNNRGIVLQQMKRYAEAIDSHTAAIAIKPDYADAYIHRGNAQQELRQYEEALSNFQTAISIRPDNADAYCNSGNVLKKLKRFPEALQNYDQALALKPNYAEAYNNRGSVFTELQQANLAFANFAQALALKPDYAEAYYNKGLAFESLQQYTQAELSYDQAIALKPDYAAAYWNKALLKLLLGDFAAGWPLYEWRWQDQQQDSARQFPQPLWLGELPIAGKTVLIYPEQGLGDFIHCCRYAALVAELGAKVVLEVPAVLFSLVSTLKGGLNIIKQGEVLPDFDLQCPMMSLPLAFKTTLDNMTACVPYLYADTFKTQLWQERLGVKRKPRIGLVWSGSTQHRNDAFRSIPLQLLTPLLSLNLDFHALQIQFRPEDERQLSNFAGLHTHQQQLNDFTDTAALAALMDLVITVDTSVAHLVGALGIPVWILLGYTTDFRWLLHRSDSPWYPTATLFRQTTCCDWASVIDNVTEKLSAYVEQPNELNP